MIEYNIVFTGTRQGMNEKQIKEVIDELIRWEEFLKLPDNKIYAIHGGCRGADLQFHHIAKGLGLPIKIYPSTLNERTSEYDDAVEVFPVDQPLKRNHSMVDIASVVIAGPSGPEVLRSGTWATIRYARKRRNLPLIICYP